MAAKVSVTGGSIKAGPGAAGINSLSAVFSSITKSARTSVSVDTVHAGPTIGTWIAGTIINIYLTPGSGKALPTLAYCITSNIQAVAPIQTGIVGATIDFLFTVGAVVVHRAATNIASHDALFYARAPVKARTICTGHSTNIAVLAIETPRTYTLVVIFQVITAASVPAGVAGALIALDLTVGTGESWPTVAGVAPLSSVGAAGAVSAWLMVGTVVQVLIAEEATPALLTGALKRLRAGSMQTTWISHTLIAKATLPSHAALTFSGHFTETVRLTASRKTDWFSAILALPASQAEAPSFIVTDVMAKGVISRTAVIRTAVAIIMLITGDMIGVAQFTLLAQVNVLRPVLPNGQAPASGQSTDEIVRIFSGFLCCKCAPGLNNKRENSRPFEVKGDPYGCA